MPQWSPDPSRTVLADNWYASYIRRYGYVVIWVRTSPALTASQHSTYEPHERSATFYLTMAMQGADMQEAKSG